MKNLIEVNTIKEAEAIEDAGLALTTKTSLNYYLEAYGVESLEGTSEGDEPQKVRMFVIQDENVLETLIKAFDIEHAEKNDDGYCVITTIEQEIDQARIYVVHENNIVDEGIRAFFEDELED